LDPTGLYSSFVVDNNKIHIYELAKGQLISEIDTDLASINLHRFGGTGKEYITIDSTRNIVRFFKLDSKLTNLIQNIQGEMVQNPDFWKDYPIYLSATSNLTDKEKQLLKELNLKRHGDPHTYHPFLEKSIVRANQMNETLRQTQDAAAFKEQGLQAQIMSTVD